MSCLRHILFLFLPALWGSAAAAQVSAEQAIARSRSLVAIKTCSRASTPDEITVCGREASQYRLPIPIERSPYAANPRGEIPRPSANVALHRECGVHRGQRQCGLRELRAWGYGGGSVPIRALVMLGKTLVDPDAELGPLAGYPINPSEGD